MIKDILKLAAEKMSKAVEHVNQEFNKIRTGKASISLLEGIKIDYYGTPTPLNQVGTLSTPDYHTIAIQPWDKTIINDIEKAILNSNLGLNPVNDGNIIRVPIPPLNEERRRELVKLVKKLAEDGRISIRNIRRDKIEKLKKTEKEEHISEDDRKHAEQELQKLTDKYIKEIDNLLAKKEKEIMEV
ncbi:MAG: ribosome recycling factor [Ignavibacteria bacterium]|nr:ribosome recycling factor [Ignavibacteria bacterium]